MDEMEEREGHTSFAIFLLYLVLAFPWCICSQFLGAGLKPEIGSVALRICIFTLPSIGLAGFLLNTINRSEYGKEVNTYHVFVALLGIAAVVVTVNMLVGLVDQTIVLFDPARVVTTGRSGFGTTPFRLFASGWLAGYSGGFAVLTLGYIVWCREEKGFKQKAKRKNSDRLIDPD